MKKIFCYELMVNPTIRKKELQREDEGYTFIQLKPFVPLKIRKYAFGDNEQPPLSEHCSIRFTSGFAETRFIDTSAYRPEIDWEISMMAMTELLGMKYKPEQSGFISGLSVLKDTKDYRKLYGQMFQQPYLVSMGCMGVAVVPDELKDFLDFNTAISVQIRTASAEVPDDFPTVYEYPDIEEAIDDVLFTYDEITETYFFCGLKEPVKFRNRFYSISGDINTVEVFNDWRDGCVCDE